jgi:hypothetical protein
LITRIKFEEGEHEMQKLYRYFIPAVSLLIAAAVIPFSAVAARSLTVDVAPDLATFDAMREPVGGAAMPTGPFYIQGSIFPKGTLNPDGSTPAGATPIGLFYCWGWTFDGNAGESVVSQVFAINGRGEVHVQGIEVSDINRAITGGTAEFIGARGAAHYKYFNLPDSFSFRITFGFRRH